MRIACVVAEVGEGGAVVGDACHVYTIDSISHWDNDEATSRSRREPGRALTPRSEVCFRERRSVVNRTAANPPWRASKPAIALASAGNLSWDCALTRANAPRERGVTMRSSGCGAWLRPEASRAGGYGNRRP